MIHWDQCGPPLVRAVIAATIKALAPTQKSEKSWVKWTSIATHAIPRIIQAHQTIVQFPIAQLIEQSSRMADMRVNEKIVAGAQIERGRIDGRTMNLWFSSETS
jgi:hypothetical protein